MPAAMISFLDGEIVHADVDDLSFDVPVMEARIRSVSSNGERALFPLSAIRQVAIGEVTSAPGKSALDRWERAVFRFLDGQVLRAYIAPQPTLGRHGGVWRCVEPGATEEHRMGIPYAALKAVFEVHEWDSRPAADRMTENGGAVADAERLARVLHERSAGGGATGDEGGLLTRVRRGTRDR